MIVKLNQTKSNFTYEYEFIHKGSCILESSIPLSLFGREINFVENGVLIYKIESCLTDDLKRIFNNYPVYKSYLIKDGSAQTCGYIAMKKSSPWFGYLYYEVMINGRTYTIYEVGKGKEGLFLTIFQNEVQVAMIEKDMFVRDYKDTYTIYLKNKDDRIPIALFSVLYDAINWGNTGEHGYKAREYNYVYSLSKFVRSTYDPGFKDGVAE